MVVGNDGPLGSHAAVLWCCAACSSRRRGCGVPLGPDRGGGRGRRVGSCNMTTGEDTS